MNELHAFEQREIQRLTANRDPLPEFRPGDTVRVHERIVEGSKTRIQIFEGLCIARRNRGLNSSMIIRKISAGGIGVEKNFPIYACNVTKVEVVRRGRVRRAKLYYIRDLQGKKARIKERKDFSQQRVEKSS